MSIKMTFGEHGGKTLEWLFFKAPWYAKWIYNKGIHRQEHSFSMSAGDHFEELFARASHLTGTCKFCDKHPFAYMGLSTHVSGALGHIGFYCDDCEYTGGSSTGYYEPSFFMPYKASRTEQLMLTANIKNRYIGGEAMTQAKMEKFFCKDEYFVNATPGFFAKEVVIN